MEVLKPTKVEKRHHERYRGTPTGAAGLPDAEALIIEARQRQHRRWLIIGIIVVIAMIVSAVSYAFVSRPSTRARHTGKSSSPSKTLAQSGPFVSPKPPTP